MISIHRAIFPSVTQTTKEARISANPVKHLAKIIRNKAKQEWHEAGKKGNIHERQELELVLFNAACTTNWKYENCIVCFAYKFCP